MISMPKLYETCVLSGTGFTATDPARLIDFRLEPAGRHAYIGGTNGVGKTSNVVQPLFWLLKPREKVAGRGMRSIIDDARADNPTPYVFYSVWRLDEPKGARLDYGGMLLVAGYVISPDLSNSGEMQGDYFYFRCGLDEIQTDRDGVLARHGIDAYERDGRRNTYRFRSYEDIHARIRDAKPYGTVSYPLRRHSEFRRDLERKMLFFDIDKYAILQRAAVFQENAIGNLDKEYKTPHDFLTRLLLPIITSKSFDEDTRDRLVDGFTLCARARNDHDRQYSNLDHYRRLAAFAREAAGDARIIEGLAASLKDSLEAGKGVLKAKDSVLDSLEADRVRIAARKAALESDRARIELERDSQGIHDAEDSYARAAADADGAQDRAEEAEAAFMDADEVVLRHRAITAWNEMERSRGAVAAMNDRLSELDASDEGRLRADLSATLNLRYSQAAASQAELEDAARAEARRARERARDEDARAAAARRDVNDRNFRLGEIGGRLEAAHGAYERALRDIGCADLVRKPDETPDIAGMDARRVSFGQEARALQAKIKGCESDIAEAEGKRAAEESEIESAGRLVGEIEVKKSDLERFRRIVGEAQSGVEGLNLVVPADIAAVREAIGDFEADIEKRRVERACVADKRARLRAERDGLDAGAAHVAESMTKWLDRLGVSYQTGQSKIEKMADAGADVARILASYPYFASAVIVRAGDVDLILEKAAEEGEIWCAGSAMLLTENQAEELDALDIGDARILALPHKRYLAEGGAYLKGLDERISGCDEKDAEIKAAIDSGRAKVEALKRLEMAYETAERMVGVASLAEIDAMVAEAASRISELEAGIEAGRAETGRIGESIERIADDMAGFGEAMDELLSRSRIIKEACGRAREYMGCAADARKLSDEIKALQDEIDLMQAGADRFKAQASASDNDAVNRKLEREKFEASAASYIAYREGEHDVIEGSIDSLVSRLDALERKFDADKDRIREALDRARGEFAGKANAYNEAIDRYAGSYSKISKERIADAADETPAVCAEAAKKLDILRQRKDALHVRADAAREAAGEKRRALEDALAIFKLNHEDTGVLGEDEIGGRDFAKRIKSIASHIAASGAALREVDEMRAAVLRADSSARDAIRDCLDGYRADAGLDADLVPVVAEIDTADEFIERATRAADRIAESRRAYEGYTSYGFERNISGIRNQIEKGEERPYAYAHIVRMAKSFMGCIGLTDALEKNAASWELEALAIKGELERLDDDLKVLVCDLVNVIDGMVESARQVEKRSGNVLRLSGMGTGHPDGDSVFESQMSAWVEDRIEMLAKKLARGEDIKETVKADCAEANVLLNRWARYKSGRDTEPELRILNGKMIKQAWKGWVKFNKDHSGGEKSTTMHQVGAALLSLCKPVDPDTGKTLDNVSIPFIQDAPFKSVSDANLIDSIFNVYENNGVQLISVADDSPETVRAKFQIRYRLVTGKTHGGFTINAREETGVPSIIRASYIDDYKGPIQQSLFEP